VVVNDGSTPWIAAKMDPAQDQPCGIGRGEEGT
jgi:hypothetical protein